MPDGIEEAFALLNDQPASAPAPNSEATSPEVQRLTDALGAAETEKAELKTMYETRAQRKALEGKVVDVDAAMKLLDPAKHLDDEGDVRLPDLFRDYSFLEARSLPPTAPNGGGGPQNGYAMPTMEQAIRSGEPAQINMVFDNVLKR